MFLVSTGRTATKFLAKLLGSVCDDVDARHEPRPDLFHLGTAFARSEIGPEKAAKVLLGSRLWICNELNRNKTGMYVESNNNVSYLIPVVRNCFPNAKFVHIVRDGRDFVRSSCSKTVLSRSGKSDNALFMTRQDVRRRLQASDLPDNPYHGKWSRMSRFEKICWYWAYKDSIAYSELSEDPRSVMVRFEDLFDQESGFPGLWKIIDFLDLRSGMVVSEDALAKKMKSKQNSTEKYILPKWQDWTDEQIAQFTEIAGEHMIRLGYSD